MPALLLQGPIYPTTRDTVSQYLELSWVEKIIVSTWEGQELGLEHERVLVVRSPDVSFPGIGNRNRQLKSSLAGLQAYETEIVCKLRTDHILTNASLEMMKAFSEKYDAPHQDRLGLVCYPIFVGGIYPNYPFHPRDHIFWGHYHDLLTLFSIPFCNQGNGPGDQDYQRYTRAETYLGAPYCSWYDERVLTMVNHPELFLTDAAPRRGEALAVWDTLRDRVFKAFPEVDFAWPKLGLEHYWTNITKSQGEYWHEGEW